LSIELLFFSSFLSQNNVSSQKPKYVKCKRSLIVLFIATFALILTACASSTHLSHTIPANLIVPCPKLLKLESGQDQEIALCVDWYYS